MQNQPDFNIDSMMLMKKKNERSHENLIDYKK